MLRFVTPFEVKLDESTPGRFKGYGSVFGNVDLGKDRCVKGCFNRSLGEHTKNGTLPAMYWMHDRAEPIGDWLDVKEDARGLKVEGQLWSGTQETECSRKAMNLLKGTSPKGMSIGYSTKGFKFDQKSGVTDLLDVDLYEISVVGYGMNPKALVTQIKDALAKGSIPPIEEIEAVLIDAGFSKEYASIILSKGYNGLSTKNSSSDVMRELHKIIRSH